MKQFKSTKLAFGFAFLAMLFVLSVSAPSLSAQTKSSKKSSTKKTKAKKSSAKKTTTKKSEISGRLPYHYGKLKLSDEQREKIYKIQARYADKLEKLQKEMLALKKKIDSETQKVLTTTQRRNLSKFKSDAAKAKSKK